MNSPVPDYPNQHFFSDEKYLETQKLRDDGTTIDYRPEALITAFEEFKDLKKTEKIVYLGKLDFLFEKLPTRKLSTILENLLDDILEEPAEVILAGLANIIPTSTFLISTMMEEGYKLVSLNICNFLSDLVLHYDTDVRAMSRVRLGELSAHITEHDRNYIVLPVVLKLVHDESDTSNQVAGLKLLGQLAPLFTSEFIEGYVTAELVAMSNESFVNVRSESVIQMALVGTLLGKGKVLTKLLPEFGRLTRDESWEVRRAFVDHLETFSEILPIEVRGREFSAIVMNLLKDDNKWVSEKAYLKLGKFISTLDNENLAEELFASYLTIPKKAPPKFSGAIYSSIALASAKAMPDILETLGPQSWEPLRILFRELIKLGDFIQIEFAKSIHRIAKNVNQKVLHTEILEFMITVLLEGKFHVKNEALANLSLFMEALDIEHRERMADVYMGIKSDPKKWRLREIISGQFDKLSVLFTEETFRTIILPVIFQLCSDQMAVVRNKACSNIFRLIEAKKDDQDAIIIILNQMKAFADFRRFTWRFIRMCGGVLCSDHQFFKQELLELFLQASNDDVVNVRIVVAEVLQEAIDRSVPLVSQDIDIISVIKKLRSDPDKDVRVALGGENISSIDSISQNKLSSKHLNLNSDDFYNEEQTEKIEIVLTDTPSKTDQSHIQGELQVETLVSINSDEIDEETKIELTDNLSSEEGNKEIMNIIENDEIDKGRVTPPLLKEIEEI